MLQATSKLVEHATVRLSVESKLEHHHARWLRGAIGRECDRAEFHHHAGKHFIYQHPLVRYDVCGNQALIHGLAEGAFLLRGLPVFEELHLGPAIHQVVERSIQVSRLELGPCSKPIIYQFQAPYLALNQENHALWERSDHFARRRLLQRVVVGNLLSLAKAVGLHVSERLHAEVDLQPDSWKDLKPGLRLLGFRGAVQINFALPDRWGIGKSSARGFGTMVREEVGNGQDESEA